MEALPGASDLFQGGVRVTKGCIRKLSLALPFPCQLPGIFAAFRAENRVFDDFAGLLAAIKALPLPAPAAFKAAHPFIPIATTSEAGQPPAAPEGE